MTKRRFKICLFLGVFIVIATVPLALSWIANGTLAGSPRAHYLAGLSRIVGVFGAGELEENLGTTADRIYHGRTLIEFDAPSEAERKALYEEARKAVYGLNGGMSTREDRQKGKIWFEIQHEDSEWFTKRMSEFQKKYREGEKAGQP